MSEPRDYAERASATWWAENHPLRNGVRQAIFHALCRLIDNDRTLYWSVLRLHWRTGFAQSTITGILDEFIARGLLEATGERKGKGGARVYRLHHERSVEAYPDSETWEECKARHKGRRANSEAASNAEVHREPVKFDGMEVHREPVKFDGADAHALPAQDTPNFTDSHSEVHRSGARSSPIGDVEVHRFGPGSSPAGGDKVFKVLTEGVKENKGAQSARACPLARTHSLPATGDESAVHRPGGNEIAARALAMVDAFHTHCEAKKRSEVEDECLRFAKQGANVDGMLEAIRTAKRQLKDGRRPRLAAVSHALAALLRTRASVVSYNHQFSEEILHAARQLEVIFECYLDKPSGNAGSNRWHMGEWLCQCVSWDKIDATTFEAACRDVQQKANGKTPTWKGVRSALGERIRARSSDGQQPEKAKRFFDQPGATPGAFIAQGNSTLH